MMQRAARAAARGSWFSWLPRWLCGWLPALRAPCRTKPTRPFFVAHDDERCEAEILAALHHFGDAVDGHELIDQFAVAVLAGAASRPRPGPRSSRRPRLPPDRRQGCDAARAARAATTRCSVSEGAPPCFVGHRLVLRIRACPRGGVGQGFHPAMENVAAAIEHDALWPAASARSARSLLDSGGACLCCSLWR